MHLFLQHFNWQMTVLQNILPYTDYAITPAYVQDINYCCLIFNAKCFLFFQYCYL